MLSAFLSHADPLGSIADLRQQMDRGGIPSEGRFVAIAPDAKEVLFDQAIERLDEWLCGFSVVVDPSLNPNEVKAYHRDDLLGAMVNPPSVPEHLVPVAEAYRQIQNLPEDQFPVEVDGVLFSCRHNDRICIGKHRPSGLFAASGKA